MATFVGIDLGTTNSAVACRNAYGRPEVIANREGQNIAPQSSTLRLLNVS
jgi:molecular chaperone DnaK